MVQRNVTQSQKPEREGPYTRLNVYVAIVGILIGYLTLAYTAHWPPFSPTTPNPPPQGLTQAEVNAALVEPSDLTSIDANLTAENVDVPSSSSCSNNTVTHTMRVIQAVR